MGKPEKMTNLASKQQKICKELTNNRVNWNLSLDR